MTRRQVARSALAVGLGGSAVSLLIGLAILILIALTGIGCGAYRAPASYPQPQRTLWYATEIAVAVNTVQTAAIQLNKISVCEAGTVITAESGPALDIPPACHPLLSEDNVRAVGETASDIRASLRKTPEGWRAIVATGLERMTARLDNAGQVKLAAYLQAVRFLLGSLP